MQGWSGDAGGGRDAAAIPGQGIYMYVPKGSLRTYSAKQAPLCGSLVTCVKYCLRVRQS